MEGTSERRQKARRKTCMKEEQDGNSEIEEKEDIHNILIIHGIQAFLITSVRFPNGRTFY